MIEFDVRDAEKYKQWARVCFWGLAKQGKTYAALAIARGLVGPDALVGCISSEYGSSALLSKKFPHKIIDLSVDKNRNKINNPFTVERYEAAIDHFVRMGCEAIVIDSLTHVWEGTGGILQKVSESEGSTFTDGWGKVGTPVYKHLVDTILAAPCHMLMTIRAKDGWIMEPNKNGKQAPRNAGSKPNFRGAFNYEMQLTIRMDRLVGHIEESAFQDEFPQGAEIINPEDVAYVLLECLDGTPLPEPTEQQAEMRKILDNLYDISPKTYARFANWEQMALRAGLGIQSGPLPGDYTDEQIEAMRAYVESKKPQPKPVASEPKPAPAAQSNGHQAEPEPAQEPATDQQRASIEKLCERLKKPVPQVQNFNQARETIRQLTAEVRAVVEEKKTEQSEAPAEKQEPAPAPNGVKLIAEGQMVALLNLYEKLGQQPPDNLQQWSFEQAAVGLKELSKQLNKKLKSKAS